MVQIEYIKKLHFKEGKSTREISKLLGHSRNTVSKYLKADVFKEPKYKLNKHKIVPVLDPVKPIIDQWPIEDEQMPKKQRHSAVRIYQRLVEEYGFAGGCSTVRNYVYSKKSIPKNAFIPLEYELGNNA
jgi:transposase